MNTQLPTYSSHCILTALRIVDAFPLRYEQRILFFLNLPCCFIAFWNIHLRWDFLSLFFVLRIIFYTFPIKKSPVSVSATAACCLFCMLTVLFKVKCCFIRVFSNYLHELFFNLTCQTLPWRDVHRISKLNSMKFSFCILFL